MEGEGRSSSSLNAVNIPPGQSPAEESTNEGVVATEIESLYEVTLSKPDNIEKRFPIDRRKLEHLIIAGKDNQTAEEYFQHVMKSTNTVILWPSKLKIGAKSKKDPQVKVAGPPEAVNEAREMILSELDTKTNRVTLKVNVANIEHSHVIGREGTNIKKVHQDTQCHIHFPDSNRYGHGDKSDQVSITGFIPAVEVARTRVRELQPIVVAFSLPLPGHMTLDPNSPDIVQISETYNITINIKPHPQTLSMIVTIRGTMRFVDGLKLAIAKLIEYFTGDYQTPQVTLYVEIAPGNQRTVMGVEGGNLQDIMHDTCTTIQFPDPHSRYRTSQVSIIGSFDGALEARYRLMGCLPVALLFDVSDEGEQITSSFIGDLMQTLDVYISVKAKTKQFAQSVIIKSIEQNMECMYEARRKLLEVANTPHSSDHIPHIMVPCNPAVITASNKTDGDNTEDIPSNKIIIESHTSPVPSLEITDTSKPSISQTQSQTPEQEPEPESESKLGSSKGGTQARLTVKAFIDYDKKREEAHIAMKSKVEPDVTRYPTDKWAGDYFSYSMPPVPRENPSLSTTATPKGLESLSKSGFKALMKQASMERKQTISQEQNVYQDIKDLSSLLVLLGLEKYESNFAEEEVDFDTFLTMNEEDLKEVGVATLGARRKLQIAISEIRKLRDYQKPQSRQLTHKSTVPYFSGSMNKSSRQSGAGGANVRLAPGYMNMSRSVRF